MESLLTAQLPKMEQARLIRFRLPLKAPFETSFGAIDHREILLIELRGKGISAYGECVADEDPLYSYETNYTARQLILQYLLPSLGKLGTINEFLENARKIRGHPMAKAAVEGALWDLLAKAQNMPLFRLWGGTKTKIPCGVSVGIQKDTDSLLKLIGEYMEMGYRRIKVKIKPGKDRQLLEPIRKAFPDVPLMVDANAAYNLDDADLLQSMDEFRLMMIEQPLHYEDIYEHSLLQKKLKTPLCLDESILSERSARAALQLKSCRIINIKTGRVGGHTESIRIHNVCLKNEVPVWCGGMLESGIGRAHNLALASLPNFQLPGDTSASDRYWHRDIIRPAVEIDSQGYVTLPEKPGIGYHLDEEFFASIVIQTETLNYR